LLKENDALEFMALKQMTPSKSKMFSTIRAHYREMGFRKFLSRVIKISFRIAKNQLYNFTTDVFIGSAFLWPVKIIFTSNILIILHGRMSELLKCR